jgi:hypothetical protein
MLDGSVYHHIQAMQRKATSEIAESIVVNLFEPSVVSV